MRTQPAVYRAGIYRFDRTRERSDDVIRTRVRRDLHSWEWNVVKRPPHFTGS